MPSRKEKRRGKALGQKKTTESLQKTPKVLSKIDIERQKNLARTQSVQTRKNDMVREVLLHTNGEFTEDQRRLFELYLFEDRSPEETMCELRPGKKPEDQIPPDEFYRLVEETGKKMKEYIKDFTF